LPVDIWRSQAGAWNEGEKDMDKVTIYHNPN